MTSYQTNSPIFAKISGGSGCSVFVVRISGDLQAILNISNFFRIDITKLHPNFTFLAKLYVEDEFLDEALITYFKSPKSFTGEDCLEIAIHGSKYILEEIFNNLQKIGLRMALPGEFSYRAFLNGKIDLVEAEGMANLIASNTKLQHFAAKRQFLGEASKIFNQMRQEILEGLGFLESLIDFSDEDLPQNVIDLLTTRINSIIIQIKAYLANTSLLNLQEGIKLAIVGKPNAGKSSLFNQLCGREKAIVSKYAGTTRDIIEERLNFNDVPVILYDTAGIRQTNDEVELEGVKRAVSTLQKSDIKLLVKAADDIASFKDISTDIGLKVDENTILVINKIDLDTNFNKEDEIIYISALNNTGIEDLKVEIQKLLQQNFIPLVNASIIATERQKHSLNKALTHLQMFNLEKEIELAGEDLRLAARSLEEILGKVDVEDILGTIFTNFCIGK